MLVFLKSLPPVELQEKLRTGEGAGVRLVASLKIPVGKGAGVGVGLELGYLSLVIKIVRMLQTGIFWSMHHPLN